MLSCYWPIWIWNISYFLYLYLIILTNIQSNITLWILWVIYCTNHIIKCVLTILLIWNYRTRNNLFFYYTIHLVNLLRNKTRNFYSYILLSSSMNFCLEITYLNFIILRILSLESTTLNFNYFSTYERTCNSISHLRNIIFSDLNSGWTNLCITIRC